MIDKHAVVIVNEDYTAQVIAEPGVVVHLLNLSEAIVEERCPLCGNGLDVVADPFESTYCPFCGIDWGDIEDAGLAKAAAQVVKGNINVIEPVWR